MRILFKGDSTIGAGRERDNDVNIGAVYCCWLSLEEEQNALPDIKTRG